MLDFLNWLFVHVNIFTDVSPVVVKVIVIVVVIIIKAHLDYTFCKRKLVIIKMVVD